MVISRALRTSLPASNALKSNMAANAEFQDLAASSACGEEARVGCSFFLKRKNRYCKMIPGEGKKYCGEHSYLADGNEV